MGNKKTEAGKRWKQNKRERERPERARLALVEKRLRAASFVLNHAPESLVDEVIHYQRIFKTRQRALEE